MHNPMNVKENDALARASDIVLMTETADSSSQDCSLVSESKLIISNDPRHAG